MRAGADVVGVPAAFVVGHDVGAVLKHDAHAFEAQRLNSFGFLAGFDLRNPAHQNGTAAIEVFAHHHAGPGDVRCGARADLCRVFRLADVGTGQHSHHIAQRDRATARERAYAEFEPAPVAADLRIGQTGFFQPCRAGLIAKAHRQPVSDLQSVDRAFARVGDADGVRQEFTDANDGLAGAFRYLHATCQRRIERHVDIDGRAGHHGKRLAARAHDNKKRGAGQRLQGRREHQRGECIVGGRHDGQAVAARHKARELVTARWEGVDRATAVGDAATAGHGGRVTADAVVTQYRRWQAGRYIDQRDLSAVDWQAGGRVKHHAQRVHQRRCRDGHTVLRVIYVRSQQALVSADVQHAVTRLRRAGLGGHIAYEDTGGRAGLGQSQRFGVNAVAGHADDDGFGDQRVDVLVVINDAHKYRVAAGIKSAGCQQDVARNRQCRPAGHGRRWQRQKAGARIAL